MAYEELLDETTPLAQRTVLALVSPFGFAYDDAPNARSVFAIGYDSGGTLRAECRTTSPYLRFTGHTQIESGNLAVNTTIDTSQAIKCAWPGNVDGVGIVANVGSTAGTASGAVKGIGGYGVSTHTNQALAYGLDFWSGASGASISEATGVRASILASGSGKNIAEARHFAVGADLAVFATVTTMYGFYCPAMALGTNRLAYYDAGQPTGNNNGNRFKSNTQFASTTGAFGGGLGVIGIANATTDPTANPSGGGVLFVTGGALTYRGSGGTVTTIAPA